MDRDVDHTTMVGGLVELKAGGGGFESMFAEGGAENFTGNFTRNVIGNAAGDFSWRRQFAG
jgi:hypothetical protein